MKNCEAFFDIPNKQKQIYELQKISSQKDFWNNPQNAKDTLKKLKILQEELSNYNNLSKELENLQIHLELICETKDSNELNELLKTLANFKETLKLTEIKIKLSDKDDFSNAIVSLHAGSGGTESCDWVEMLLRMYLRWCDKKNMETEILDILSGEGAGIKHVTFLAKGTYAYGLLKGETGVHRLVRISPFDANKRRHTSFASCDVIPEIDEDIKIEINEQDLIIETFRASGHGGQHVNKTDSAVRIKHIPSDIVVSCQRERSQFKNKQLALKILYSKLFQLEKQKQISEMEKRYNEKGEISWGYQIRSYVLMPYRLVKDLRTNYQTQDVDSVLDGEIDDFIESYLDYCKTKKC